MNLNWISYASVYNLGGYSLSRGAMHQGDAVAMDIDQGATNFDCVDVTELVSWYVHCPFIRIDRVERLHLSPFKRSDSAGQPCQDIACIVPSSFAALKSNDNSLIAFIDQRSARTKQRISASRLTLL